MTQSLFGSLQIGDVVFVIPDYVDNVTNDHSEACQENYDFEGNFIVKKIDNIEQSGEVECIQDGVEFDNEHENAAFFAEEILLFARRDANLYKRRELNYE